MSHCQPCGARTVMLSIRMAPQNASGPPVISSVRDKDKQKGQYLIIKM